MTFQKKSPESIPRARQKTYRASATYEFWVQAPETWTGTVTATSHDRAFWMASRELRKAYPLRRPASIVILLELPENAPKEESSDQTATT